MSEGAVKPEIAAEPRRARGRPRIADLAELEARLLRVARQIFIANGYGAASMNEITKAARVSKGTIYSRFPSKAELFWAIVDGQIQNPGGWVRYAGPKPRTLEAMLQSFAERALEDSLAGEIVQLNRLVHAEAERFPELGEAAHARWRSGAQQVAAIIREYAELEDIPCRDPEAPAEMFITLIQGFCSNVMLRGKPATGAEMKSWTRRMLKLFLAGRQDW